MTNNPQRILIVRNDKLGDFMLSYPSFALLKQSLPNCETYALVPQYTREMAETCQWIDHIIIDPGKDSHLKGMSGLVKTLRELHLDAAITLFSTTRIGFILAAARIPFRLAPATKAAQFLYNHKLTQRRSRSRKPEYEYNLDLVKYFLESQNIQVKPLPELPFLHFDEQEIQQLKTSFCDTRKINNGQPIVFIHPGSGGSANNLSLNQYQQLAINLSTNQSVNIVITAGPGEFEYAGEMASQLLNNQIPHTVYQSTEGLKHFAKHIQFADIFISGSTGPLHIAGALNTPTVAFYPRRQSATSLRWQTLNSESHRLAFSPSESGNEHDMGSIDMGNVAKEIVRKFLIAN